MPIDETKIMAAVGKRVAFKYPAPEPTARGVLRSRRIAWTDPAPRPSGARYCDVVDIIKLDGQTEPWLRVGYYRLPRNGKQRWASQTTICEPLSVWRHILPSLTQAIDEATEREGP